MSQLDKNKNKKERDVSLDQVRLLGDFYHNFKVLKNGGELIVCRRPSISLRKNDNNSNKALKEFMKPVNFDLIVKCTKEIAGYSQKNADGEFLPTFKIPSLPLKIGFALSSIFMLLKGLALRIKEPEVIEDATNLSQLYASSGRI